jgi:hypothetical protein
MPRRQIPPEELPLSVRFQDGPPRREPQDRRSPLTTEEKLYILYRWKLGLPKARIGRELGVARSTVSAFVVELFRCPSLLLTLPLIRVTREAGNERKARSSFFCVWCAFRGPGGEAKARSHLVRDLFPVARIVGAISLLQAWDYQNARRVAKWEAALGRELTKRHKAKPLLSRILGRGSRSLR